MDEQRNNTNEANADDVPSSDTPSDESRASQDLRDSYRQKTLLSLDGGGIRGYWTLLALRTLIDEITLIETNDPKSEFEAVDSSFAPLALPDHVSHLPRDDDQRAMRRRRFLICHYFDLIIGSSTGALIALMLGRFRMTVDDCLNEYEKLGDEVFGHPRMFNQHTLPFLSRPKYNASKLEEVVKNVTKRRGEYLAVGDPTLPLPTGICQVCITTKRTKSDTGTAAHSYIFRTYNGNLRTNAATFLSSRAATGLTFATNRTTGQGRQQANRPARSLTNRLNWSPAQRLEIWQVARAATAAIAYFDSLTVDIKPDGECSFEDGGFGHLNNPAVQGRQEILNVNGPRTMDMAVSIGTARKEEPGGKRNILGIIKSLANVATNVNLVDEEMEKLAADETQGAFYYYRFNADWQTNVLDVPLDQWEPKGIKAKLRKKDAGSKTIQTITTKFREWVDDPEVREYFRDCARALVTKRRLRARDTNDWELYANVVQYTCNISGCHYGADRQRRRGSFQTHLEEEHAVLPNRIDANIADHSHCWRYREPT